MSKKTKLAKRKLNLEEKVYITLEKLSEAESALHKHLNDRGYSSLTVCPRCRVDDFVHVEGCELQKINNL